MTFIVGFVIVQTIVFLVIFLVLRRMMIRNTMSAINRLKVTDDENAKRLEGVKKKMEETEADYQRKSAELAQELEKQREEAKKKMEEEKNRHLAKSREEGDRILSGAKSRSEKMGEDLEKEVDARASAFAAKIVREALSGTIKSAVNDHLVDELLKEFAGMDIGHVPDQIAEAEALLPHPFSPERKKKVQEILEKKMSRKITLKETVKQEMIGGMILKLGSLVLDGSLDGVLTRAARGMKK